MANSYKDVDEEKEKNKIRASHIAGLKAKYDQLMSQIESLGKQADEIVDTLDSIETNVPDISVGKKPVRVQSLTATKFTIPKK